MITGERETEKEREMWIHYQLFCNTRVVLQFNSNSHIMFSTTGKLQTTQLQIKWFSTPVSRYSSWQVFFSFWTTYDLFHDGCLNRWLLYSPKFTIIEPEKYELSTSLKNPAMAKNERGLSFLSLSLSPPLPSSKILKRSTWFAHTDWSEFGHLPPVSQHCTGLSQLLPPPPSHFKNPQKPSPRSAHTEWSESGQLPLSFPYPPPPQQPSYNPLRDLRTQNGDRCKFTQTPLEPDLTCNGWKHLMFH